jgi:hypothetical protein
VETARAAESSHALPVLDATLSRGYRVETVAMDKGYDNGPIHDGCEIAGRTRSSRSARRTPSSGEHEPPCCEHGTWTFRRSRLRARGDQVALPDRRVQAA